MTTPIQSAFITEGVELLRALASASLGNFFRCLSNAQQFLDDLHAGRTDAEVLTLFLSKIAPSAVHQLATAGETDAAASLLESISSLRLTQYGPRFGKDPDAVPLLADLNVLLLAPKTLRK